MLQQIYKNSLGFAIIIYEYKGLIVINTDPDDFCRVSGRIEQ